MLVPVFQLWKEDPSKDKKRIATEFLSSIELKKVMYEKMEKNFPAQAALARTSTEQMVRLCPEVTEDEALYQYLLEKKENVEKMGIFKRAQLRHFSQSQSLDSGSSQTPKTYTTEKKKLKATQTPVQPATAKKRKAQTSPTEKPSAKKAKVNSTAFANARQKKMMDSFELQQRYNKLMKKAKAKNWMGFSLANPANFVEPYPDTDDRGVIPHHVQQIADEMRSKNTHATPMVMEVAIVGTDEQIVAFTDLWNENKHDAEELERAINSFLSDNPIGNFKKFFSNCFRPHSRM